MMLENSALVVLIGTLTCVFLILFTYLIRRNKKPDVGKPKLKVVNIPPKIQLIMLSIAFIATGYLVAILTTGTVYLCYIQGEYSCFDTVNEIIEVAVYLVGLPFTLYFLIDLFYNAWKDYKKTKVDTNDRSI